MREAGFMFAAWACGMVRSHLAAGKALQGAGTFCKHRGAPEHHCLAVRAVSRTAWACLQALSLRDTF